MIHHEIDLPSYVGSLMVEQAVNSVCEVAGLSVGLQTTLASYPGCVHWHWKMAQERGTLEVTFWPKQNRLWISVHANREANWTDAAALDAAASLQAIFGVRPSEGS